MASALTRSKHSKIQYFCINSNFFGHFLEQPSGPSLMPHFVAWASGWTTSDFLQLKPIVSSTRNDMFWKKLAFRLDETPTSELGFACHKLSRRKKVSKTRCFSTLFLAGRISCDHSAPLDVQKIAKRNMYLVKRKVYNRNVQKLDTFDYFLARVAATQCPTYSEEDGWNSVSPRF